LTQALLDYGLFVAKTLTLLVAIALLLGALLRGRRELASDGDDGHRLEIADLGQRYRQMADALRQATLPPKAYKASLKAQRKADKARARADAMRPRLYVIDFRGDLMASEVGNLREAVSALLLVAAAGDQVLLRLENAGGAVHEHGLAAAQLLRLRARDIQLTVAIDKVAASGGYLMACVANRIIAAPFAVIGSIGVLAALPNFHRWLSNHGIDFEQHTAGEHKRTLSLFGENTEEGRAKLREQLEETHAQFKAFIRTHRPELDLDRVATGEYWHGERALQLGLLDELCTSDDYLLTAQAEHDLYRVSYRSRKRPIERLLGTMRHAIARCADQLETLRTPA